MTIVDSYPNAERTITLIEASLISNREYERLKGISKYIKEIIERETQLDTYSYSFVKQVLDQAIKNSQCAFISNDTHKEIIIGNIILPDDIQIAEILTKNKFTLEHLKERMRFRSLLKNIIL